MSNKREKVNFFEREVITDSNHAQSIITREDKKFRFILICTALSLVSSVFGLLAFTPVLDWPIFAWLDIGNISEIIWIIGIVGTILTGPVNVIKAIVKIGTYSWFIIPVFPINLIVFCLAMGFTLVALAIAPVVFAAYNLYISYLNKKEAESFIASFKDSKNNADQSCNHTQVYKCPTCQGMVTCGEDKCQSCGTKFNW